MHKFVRHLITEWRRLKLPVADETLVVAVSGGADSVSLLLAFDELRKCRKLRLRIVAAHFDHGLRGSDGRADEDCVRSICEQRGIEFTAGRADGEFALPHSGNLEERARIARYRFLGSLADRESAYAVAVAHTLDDQAETFLINLIRGGGRAGLSAMRAISAAFITGSGDSGFRLVRPLLGWARRSDTERFCADSGTLFRSDPMNADPRFTRVRVRRELIPLLASFNPKVVENIARASRLVAESAEASATEAGDAPRVADLARLEQPARFDRIRAWLAAERGHLRGIGLKQIDAIDRLALSRKSGREAELPGGASVIKRGGGLIFRPAKAGGAPGSAENA